MAVTDWFEVEEQVGPGLYTGIAHPEREPQNQGYECIA
jgi:hypothetical protein